MQAFDRAIYVARPCCARCCGRSTRQPLPRSRSPHLVVLTASEKRPLARKHGHKKHQAMLGGCDQEEGRVSRIGVSAPCCARCCGRWTRQHPRRSRSPPPPAPSYLSIYLSIYIYIYIYLYVSLSLYIYIVLSIYLFIYPYI